MTVPSMSNVSIANAVSMAVASKQLDAARAQGRAMNSLIEAAASVGRAGRGEVSATALPGEGGGRLDVSG